MGFDDLTGKASDGLNSEKGEELSDQGLDKAGEFAEGKLGGGGQGGEGGNQGGEGGEGGN